MNKPSSKTLHGLILLAFLLVVLALLLAVQRSGKLQSSIESGRFESRYTSVIEALQTKTQTLRDKLSGSMPGDLKLLPEELLRRARNADEEAGNPESRTHGKIRLRGIYWSDSMPLAEINNRLCKPGDEIAGFTLEEIHPYQIILVDLEGNRQTNSLIKGIESRIKTN